MASPTSRCGTSWGIYSSFESDYHMVELLSDLLFIIDACSNTG